jgi:hypothetical protein
MSKAIATTHGTTESIIEAPGAQNLRIVIRTSNAAEHQQEQVAREGFLSPLAHADRVGVGSFRRWFIASTLVGAVIIANPGFAAALGAAGVVAVLAPFALITGLTAFDHYRFRTGGQGTLGGFLAAPGEWMPVATIAIEQAAPAAALPAPAAQVSAASFPALPPQDAAAVAVPSSASVPSLPPSRAAATV